MNASLAAMASVGLGAFDDAFAGQRIPAPQIAPAAGLFADSVTVSLLCPMRGASIYFTLDASEPVGGSALYTDPFSLTNTTIVKARASLNGEFSPIAIATFKRQQLLTHVPETTVQITGRLGARYGATIAYLIALHDQTISAISFDMLYPFLNRGMPGEQPWDGEYAGKWLDAASLIAANTGDAGLNQRVSAFATTLRDTQLPDGYMGIDTNPGGAWDLWNMWYVLYGMMSHQENQGDAEAGLCAVNTGAYITAHYLPPKNAYSIFSGAWDGGCSIDVLGQLIHLHEHTGQAELLDLAELISSDYPPINQMRSEHTVELSHAYVVCAYLGGMTQYARALANMSELDWIEAVWDDVVAEHLFHTYSIGEGETFVIPQNYWPHFTRQETCATVEWLLWTGRLYEATGDIRYADQIENTIYNALLAAQATDGMHWMYHTPIDGTKSWFSGPTKCCYWSGPRGIARLTGHIYHVDSDGIRVDLYEAGTAANINVNGAIVSITQVTSYPAQGNIVLIINPSKPAQFKLKLRLPPWAQDLSVAINGVPAAVPLAPGQYAELDRTWQAGDQVEFHTRMSVTLRTTPNMPNMPGAVVQRGPEVLSLDSRDNPGLDFTSVQLYSNPILTELASDQGRRRYRCAALVSGKPADVIFTPYADAGNDGASFQSRFFVSDQTTPVKLGDVNGDGAVNVDDLLAVINSWGQCPPQPCPADIAPTPMGNGYVNVDDLLLVINQWG